MFRVIIFFFIGFLCLFIASKTISDNYTHHKLGKSSAVWVPVEAQVESFELNKRAKTRIRAGRYRRVHFGSEKFNSYVDIIYHYTFDGKDYTGERAGFGAYDERRLKRPKNGRTLVYVNPDNPTQSTYIKDVYKPDVAAFIYAIGIGFIGLFSVVLGAKTIVYIVKSGKDDSPE